MGSANPWLAAALGTCALIHGSSAFGSDRSTLQYAVSVDEALDHMTVTLCMEGLSPPYLEAGGDEMRRYLKRAFRIEGKNETPLGIDGDRIMLGSSGSKRSCVRMEIDLEAARNEHDRDVAMPVGRDMILSPDLFLWQPNDIPDDAEVTVEFSLPRGVSVTTPWAPITGTQRFRLPPSAFEWQAMMTLGRSVPTSLQVRGATLTVARLDHPTKASPRGIEHWLRTAAGAVTKLYGVFPIERTQVIVDPVRGDSVEFGYVVRGGGATVLFFLGDEAADDELPGEWVAVHEFSHLALPFVSRNDAWLSEGFATYFQEVLRARAGLIPPKVAWQHLFEGFERGKGQVNRRSLADNSARMGFEHRFMRVYWSGAAIWLLGDVALRRQSGGKKSLDTALLGLRACCLHDAHLYPASEVLEILDREAGTQVFRRLYDRWAPSKEFPDLRETYRLLGLAIDGDQVQFEDGAPLAKVRDAIMTAPAR
jgi:hypothetical protein